MNIRLSVFALVFALFAPIVVYAHGPAACEAALTVPWNKEISFTKTEKLLRDGTIVDIRDMFQALKDSGKKPSGTVGTLLITMADGTRAVFKPNRWHMADGEEGAYKISRQLLDSRQIPPTIRRDIGPELQRYRGMLPDKAFEITEGSLQYFVSSSLDIRRKSVRDTVWPQVSERKKSDKDIFYFVFGQWDRHWGNLIIDDSLTPALIDNASITGRQQVRFGEDPYQFKVKLAPSAQRSDWPAQFPFDQVKIFDHPSVDELPQYLKGLAEPNALENFLRHWSRNEDRSCAVVIWQNAVWIRSIGYAHYESIQPKVISQKTLDEYTSLTFEKLRAVLLPEAFSDIGIHEMLARRDQILEAAKSIPKTK